MACANEKVYNDNINLSGSKSSEAGSGSYKKREEESQEEETKRKEPIADKMKGNKNKAEGTAAKQQLVGTPKENTKKIIDFAQGFDAQMQQDLHDQLVSQINTNKKSDVSTISKTPPHQDNQSNVLQQMASYFLSPMFFKKKQESRFQFAHSVDPIKQSDLEEIEVPAKIQDLIERNIRTLSNSISNKSDIEKLDLKDMKEKWLTKIEIMMQTETSPRNRNRNEQNYSIEEQIVITFPSYFYIE